MARSAHRALACLRTTAANGSRVPGKRVNMSTWFARQSTRLQEDRSAYRDYIATLDPSSELAKLVDCHTSNFDEGRLKEMEKKALTKEYQEAEKKSNLGTIRLHQ